jgi:hypothetical protein
MLHDSSWTSAILRGDVLSAEHLDLQVARTFGNKNPESNVPPTLTARGPSTTRSQRRRRGQRACGRHLLGGAEGARTGLSLGRDDANPQVRDLRRWIEYL